MSRSLRCPLRISPFRCGLVTTVLLFNAFDIARPTPIKKFRFQEWKARIQSEHASLREKALAEIDTLTLRERRRAISYLERVHQTRQRECEKLVKRVHKALGRIDTLPRAEVVKTVARWREAADRALEFIRCERSFPDPNGDPRFRGPYDGAATAERHEEQCTEYKERVERLIEKAVHKYRRLRPKQARQWIDRYESLRSLLRAIAPYATTSDSPPILKTLHHAMLNLKIGRIERATDSYLELDEITSQFVFYRGYLDGIHALNKDASRNDIRVSLERLNELRVVFLLHPLQRNPRVERAALGHCQEMNRLGYYGHKSPLEGRAHALNRLHREGYAEAFCAYENIDRIEDPLESLRRWRWDGPHFRTMLAGRASQVGLAVDGRRITMVCTSGQPTQWPVLSPPR